MARSSAPVSLIEERRLAGVGVADERDDRTGHALAFRAVAGAHVADALKVTLDLADARLDLAAVRLDLRLARAAEEAEAAALALKVRPGTDEAALLVVQVGKLDLQAPFPRLRPLAEDFEDKPGAVEDLRGPGFLKIALLYRAHRMIDDDHLGIVDTHEACNLFDLAGADERGRRELAKRHDERCRDIEPDRLRQIDGLGEARLARPGGRSRRLACAPALGKDDKGLGRGRRRRTAAVTLRGGADRLVLPAPVAWLQSASPASSASGSKSCTGCDGITVEMACL